VSPAKHSQVFPLIYQYIRINKFSINTVRYALDAKLALLPAHKGCDLGRKPALQEFVEGDPVDEHRFWFVFTIRLSGECELRLMCCDIVKATVTCIRDMMILFQEERVR